MRYKFRPADFLVEEQIAVPLGDHGPYAVYRVRKEGVTTLQVQVHLAKALGRPRGAVNFPALKDKDAIAVQYASVKGSGPPVVEGRGFVAQRVGYAHRFLRPADLRGNRFTVVLRDLAPGGVAGVKARLDEVTRFGVPNYFDEQRFGSMTAAGDFIGKRVLQRDVEGALRAYLAEPLAGDPPEIRAFKGFAARHWGDWSALFDLAPKPSNFRSVLTFLKDHPDDHLRALNLIPRRLLSLYLSAYQSFLWNRIAGRFLAGRLEAAGLPVAWLQIACVRLPVYRNLPDGLLAALSQVTIPLPHLRATFADTDLKAAAEAVLQAEGLTQGDLKARVLKNAYLTRGQRALLVFPEDVKIEDEAADDEFPGRRRLALSFSLPPGSYATLILKALATSLASRLDRQRSPGRGA